MDRFAHILDRLKAFAFTRPVAYGAPACALVGALAGLAMQTGPQEAPFQPETQLVGFSQEAMAEPISWPSGKIPDYVIGTDFLETTQASPPVQMASHEPDFAPPPPLEVAPYQARPHGPAMPPPNPDSPSWPSQRGDILDISLPEDRAPQPVPTVLADAAATGMTTR